MHNIVDILKGATVAHLSPDKGVDCSTLLPANTSEISRFRSTVNNMQMTAKISIKQEILRICDLPIIEDPTEEEIEEVRNYYCPDGTIKLYPIQVKALMHYHEYGGQVSPVPVGQGKCVEGDTIVVDLERGRRRADDLGSFKVPSMGKGGKIVSKQATSFASGTKHCIQITLKAGQSIRLSTDHPVFTQRGWIHAGKLNFDDLVATSRRLPEPKRYNDVFTDEEIKISAYLCADGGNTGLTPSFTNANNAVINEMLTSLHTVGGILTEQQSKSKAREFYVRGITKYRDVLFSRELSKNKRIPANFYLLTSKQTALFLNRFITCDGHINIKGGIIEITLASEGLIDDIQFLLLRLGILSRKHYKQASYRKEGNRYFFDSWRLTLSGKPNILRFFTKVGNLYGQEIKSAKMVAKVVSKKHNTNTDVVPISVPEFHEICDELGYLGVGGDPSLRKGRPRTDLRKLWGITKGQYISRIKFEKWVDDTGYSGKYAWLAKSDIAWEKIANVKDRGLQSVYDLSVPSTHNFVGNGIILHNTLISVLIANDAYSIFGKRKIILMNPPNLINQLRHTELPLYRRHISINVPFHWVAGDTDAKRRMRTAKSNRAGCYVVSYSLLSGRQGAEILDAILGGSEGEGCIIGDEIHAIASASNSARGKRFKEAVKKYSPQLIGLSGTISKKSPRDYHHLAVNALHENCFMPRNTEAAEDWSRLIDSNASSMDEIPQNANIQPGPIKPLIDWAKHNFPKEEFPNNLIGFRAAYQKRLKTSPGVVASEGESLGVSLRISNVSITKEEKEQSKGWGDLKKLIDQLVNQWIAPNGDEIDHAMHLWRWRYELEGFGFYNNLYWPSEEKVAEKRKIILSASIDILERSKHHHELRQTYLKELRRWITHRSKKGLDTPFLIAGDMYRNGDKNVGSALYTSWVDVKDANFEGIVEREKEIVRVCDFRVNKIVEWAIRWHKEKPKKGAIIWYKNKGVAEWLRDKFIEADLPMLYCPAGTKGRRNIEDRNQGDKFAITSISSYHKGLNLQYHHNVEFFAQWPREAHIAHQAIGRVHRNEQPNDECRIFQSICSDFDRVNFAACLNDAAYIHQTLQDQKLMYADYDERPTVLPHAVLMEWGTEARQLNKIANQRLVEKFKGE